MMTKISSLLKSSFKTKEYMLRVSQNFHRLCLFNGENRSIFFLKRNVFICSFKRTSLERLFHSVNEPLAPKDS
jgi:hypothetical protein